MTHWLVARKARGQGERTMRLRTHNQVSLRSLGASLAALTVAVPLAAGLLAPGHTTALAPLALVLPFVTMGVLDAARRSNRFSRT